MKESAIREPHVPVSIDKLKQLIIADSEPFGVIIGLNRIPTPECNTYHSHLYYGTFSDPKEPLCPYGWNRGKDSYSIWRGNVGRGICKRCLKRAYREYVLSLEMLNKSNVSEDALSAIRIER